MALALFTYLAERPVRNQDCLYICLFAGCTKKQVAPELRIRLRATAEICFFLASRNNFFIRYYEDCLHESKDPHPLAEQIHARPQGKFRILSQARDQALLPRWLDYNAQREKTGRRNQAEEFGAEDRNQG